MPDLKISQLPVASATTGAELFPVVQGGVTKQIALNAVRHIGSAVFDANGSMAVDTNTLFVDAVNNLVGFGTLTPASRAHAVVADGSYSVAGSGTTRGFRVEHNTTETRVVGVDNTLTGSFQPLSLGGSTVLVRTNGSTLTATFDASGNLGLGVTPSAWINGRGIDVGSYVGLSDNPSGGGGFALSSNAYEYSSGAWKYKNTYFATLYRTYAGQHEWLTAPSGTAGNAISFTQDMTLTGGRLGIGTATPDRTLQVSGNAIATVVTGADSLRLVRSSSSLELNIAKYWNGSGNPLTDGNKGDIVAIGNAGGDGLVLVNGNTERARITAAGSVVVGTAALATSATDGFLYVPTCAGTPTGVPTTQTGTAAIVINTTNNKLYFYSGGAWRDAGP
jgi:hypothetical protein